MVMDILFDAIIAIVMKIQFETRHDFIVFGLEMSNCNRFFSIFLYHSARACLFFPFIDVVASYVYLYALQNQQVSIHNQTDNCHVFGFCGVQ